MATARLAGLRRRFTINRRARRRNLVSLAITLGVAVLFSVLQVRQSGDVYGREPLFALEAAFQDGVIRGRNPSAFVSNVNQDPRKFITIVAMDDKSIRELGDWRQWPRTYYAGVLENLLAAPPRVVAFDIGFFDPTASDDAFVAALDKARALRPATAVVLGAAGGGNAEPGLNGDLQYTDGLFPIERFRQLADVGVVNMLPDAQGTVRTIPLLLRAGDTQYTTLGFAAAAKYLRQPQINYTRPAPHTLAFQGREVPVTPNGVMRINYFGGPSFADGSQQTFRLVSLVDVLRGRAEPTWRNGIVFVGLLGATGFADDYWTPVSERGYKMAGVEIHANVAATLLSTQYLKEAPLPLHIALVALLCLLVGLFAANLGVIGASAATVLLLGAYGLGNAVTLDQSGLQLAFSTPIIGGALTYMAITAYRVVVEQRQTRALQGALASVIPPTVAQEIARDPDRVKMGGERREISVLFTDLKGFTTFSETVTPEVLSRIITEYLNAMTAVVFRNGGTVDKFIGDAVMAFWNAPLDVPDHAWMATKTALEMQQTLRQLGDKWQSEGYPRQYMRIGINTGFASVGNMGTSQRFAYTALGDTVNLGARLEPLNNEYGTWICISQHTLDKAGGREKLLVRFLDLVAVKGKNEPVPVYELVGFAEDKELEARYAPILEPYQQAMLRYQARQFEEAAVLFETAMRAGLDGHDEPSAVYLERCRALATDPPPVEWDGVYVMKHK